MRRKHTFMRWTAFLLTVALMGALAPLPALGDTLASSPLVTGATRNGMVRVYLSSLGNPSMLNITVSGSYTVNGSSTRTLTSGSSVTVRFNASTGALTLTSGGATTDMGAAFKLRRHETSGTNGLKIAQAASPNNLYPGDLSFIVRQNGASYKLYTIAYIYMEDYLYGVLPYEMNNSCPLEALKAQAVASRTYTLRAMTAAATKNIYDVVDTTSDQVYRGTPSGNQNCVAAVNATKGIVSMNGADFTATYYTASNGGQTESVKNAWNTTANSYLSVKDDPYDLASSGARVRSFTVNASGAQGNGMFGQILANKAMAVLGGEVTRVYAVVPHTPKYPSPSRLYTKLDFSVAYTRAGYSLTGTLTFDIFSELEEQLNMSLNAGDNEIWSVDAVSGGFIVRARRYGHGIGMSQNGAMHMAGLGYTYDQILAFYFTDCRRVQYSLTRSILSAVVEGYDSSEEITAEDPAEITGGTGCTGVVSLISSAYTLPLRASASAAGDALCALPNNATVNVHGQLGDYYFVSYGKLVGYALKSSLRVSGAVPGATTLSPTVLYGYAKVKSALNFRQSASRDAKVLATLSIGTVLPVFSVSGEWAYAQYGLLAGYVHTDYITLSGVNPSAQTDPNATGATLNTDAVMRFTASTGGYAIASLFAGTEVAMLSQSGSWTMIRYNKMTGFVLTTSLTPTGRTTAQTAEDAVGAGESIATVTAATSLNLRNAPSMSGELMIEMPGRSTMIVVSRGAEWTQVRYLGVRGYCMSKYLTFSSATVSPTQTPSSTGLYAKVTTNSGSLNLRNDASSTAKVIGFIPKGAVIPLYTYGGEWCATNYNGVAGYVMSKFVTLVSSGATAAPTLAPTAAPSQGTTYARVNTRSGSLNLRESADANARVLYEIPQNSYLVISSYGAVWCATAYAGYTGYVMTRFLAFDVAALQPSAAPTTPAPTVPPSSGARYARVTTRSGSLNLREAPNGDARVLTTIPQNTYLTLSSYSALWCGVTYNGYAGYVMTSFLSLVAQLPSVTPTPTPTAAPTAQPSGARYARVTTRSGSLNLREAPDGDARVLTTIPQNAVIPISLYGATWSATTYNGYTGYVMTRFITLTAAATAAPTAAQNSYDSVRDATLTTLSTSLPARITPLGGSYLNLRAGCSTYGTVLKEMPTNDYLMILAVGDYWCYVEYEGTRGYCLRAYLTFSQ